jgi:transposase
MALSDSEKPTKSVETSRRRERVLLKSPATDEARRLMRRMNRLFRSAGSRPDEDSLARQIAECATALDTARSVTQEAEKEDNSPLDSAPSGGFDSLEASINALDSAFLWRTLAYRSLEGKALVASIRASVGSIDVFMPQKRKLKPRTHLKERPKTAASEPVLCVCESAESHPPEPKEYAESARLRLLEKYHKDAVALSDAEWSAVAMEVSENVERPVRSPSCYTSREIVNFAVFASRADANLEMLPRERGSKVDLKGAMKRLVNSGSLRRIEIKLKELWPDKFKYLHAEKFSRYAYKENQKSAALAKNLEIEAKSGLGIFPSHVSDIVSSALARSGRKDLQLRLRTVEAAIFILRQSAPNSAMPPYYGGAQVFKNEMSQLVRSGAWDRVVADLKSSDLGFLEGLNLSRFDNLPRASVAPSRLREGTDFRPHGVFLEVLQNSPQALSTKELAKTVAISLGYSTDGIESKQLRSLALGSMIYWRRRGKVKKSFEHGESWSVVPGDAVV